LLQNCARAQHPGPCAAFSLLESTYLSPCQKEVGGVGWLGVGTQVRHGARVQRLAPCAAFSLLGDTCLSQRK